MMTALYVFIGVLAAALVVYIFDRFVGFVRKIKRKLDENNVMNRASYTPPRTPYYGYYGMYGEYGPNYGGLNDWRLSKIQDKLNDLLEKVNLIEDAIVNDPKNG